MTIADLNDFSQLSFLSYLTVGLRWLSMVMIDRQRAQRNKRGWLILSLVVKTRGKGGHEDECTTSYSVMRKSGHVIRFPGYSVELVDVDWPGEVSHSILLPPIVSMRSEGVYIVDCLESS